jgi:tRNA G18 (ribose-2'-O)-methylase SpoU
MALSPPIAESPEEVRALLAPLRHPFSVAVHNCQNPFAVGAIIRVAHSFLAREIFVVGDAPYYAKASMGMEKYETIVRTPSEAAFLDRVRGRPLWAAEKERATVCVYDAPFPRDVVLVFGSERAGLPESLLARADAVVGIPMYGVNQSFPVAVAAGIVMSECVRRLRGSGHPRR